MDIMELGTIGELVGGVAVIASLPKINKGGFWRVLETLRPDGVT